MVTPGDGRTPNGRKELPLRKLPGRLTPQAMLIMDTSLLKYVAVQVNFERSELQDRPSLSNARMRRLRWAEAIWIHRTDEVIPACREAI